MPSSLVKLMLINCRKLKALINLSNIVNLKFLNIVLCEELETSNVEGVNLKFLNIVSCEELETVNVEGLIQLEEIQAYICSKLWRGLIQLEEIQAYKCSKLQRIGASS